MTTHGHNRRQFLQRTALSLAGATLASAVPGPAPSAEAGQGVQARAYVAGRYMMVLDGVQCGFVKSIDGGNITADVVTEPAAAGPFANKRLGTVRVEPFRIGADFSMNGKLFSWLAGAAAGGGKRQDGVIIACDYDYNAKSQREFSEALITEIGFPACDAASKEAGVLTVAFQPQTMRVGKGSGKVSFAAKNAAQRLWLPSNFRLEIDGLDCTKVNTIDAFRWKQGLQADELGNARDMSKEPGMVEVPNLNVTFPEVSAQTWTAWHEDFVIKGNNDDGQEKGGRLVFLSPNRQTELMSLIFHNLGIFRLADDKDDANPNTIKRLRAEMYCEKVEVSYNAAVLG